MKKAVLFRFSMILFVALAVSSAISYFFMGNRLLVDNEKNLLNIVLFVPFLLPPREKYRYSLNHEVSDICHLFQKSLTEPAI